jgi:hypothetical protein
MKTNLREVTVNAPIETAADKLMAQILAFNAPACERVTLTDREAEHLRAIAADVDLYVGGVWKRCNGNEAFTTEVQDLANVLSEWFTLQTESEQHMIGDVEVNTPALESPTIRAVVFAKGKDIAARIEAIEGEIVAAARRRAEGQNHEESELLAYLEQDSIAARLADVICEAGAECQRAEANYHAAPAQAPVPGGEWRFVEALVAALELRFREHKFAGVHASQVWSVLSRARSKGRAIA